MKSLAKVTVKLMILTVLSLFAFNLLSAQTPPSLILPANNASCVPKQYVFSWGTVTDAAKYRLQISTSATWTSPDVLEEVITDPTSTFSVTLPTGNLNYYWRVSASFTDHEDFSATRTFKSQGDFPTLQLPTDAETCVDKSTLFKWTSITGAETYRLQVASSTTFSGGQLVYDYQSIPSTTFSSVTFTATMPQNYKTYYWRVYAQYNNCISDWSDTNSFTVKQAAPGIVYPTANATGIPTSTSLSWTQVTPASTYDIQVATNSNFTSIVQSFVDLNQTTTTLATLNYNSTYYWRMKSRLSGCESDWSPAYMFKTVYDAPALNSPYEGRICLDLSGYKFEWYSVPSVLSYQLQISKDSLFVNLVVNQENIFDLFYSNATLPEGLTQYFWRVRAKDNNNTGNWSNFRRFTTTISPVQPVYPQNNSGGAPLSLVFKWTDVTKGAGTYHLQVSRSATFADTMLNVTSLASTTYSYTLPSYNVDYYWRVSADYGQCEIGYSTPWKFRSVIAAPNLTSPANGTEDLSFNVFFEWTVVPDATSYTIHIAETPDFSPVTFGYSGLTNNHYYKSGLSPDKEYYWKVQAENEFGAGPFSSVRSFTTITRGPTVPILSMPYSGSEQIELNPTLRWLASDRAEKYHLQVADNETFSTPLVNTDTITRTYYNLSGLLNDVKYYWHVSAINDSGETNWSIPWHFSTLLIAPDDSPILSEPADGASGVDVNLLLKWNAVEYATIYEVLVAKTDDFSGELFLNDPMCFANQKNIGGLEYQTKYYWKVRAKNASGIGPWSETRSFTVKTLGSVNDEAIAKYKLVSYPNPFAESNYLNFTLVSNNNVTIKLYNLAGIELQTLINKQLPAGEHIISWKPSGIESGMYLYSIQIGDTRFVKEVKFIK